MWRSLTLKCWGPLHGKPSQQTGVTPRLCCWEQHDVSVYEPKAADGGCTTEKAAVAFYTCPAAGLISLRRWVIHTTSLQPPPGNKSMRAWPRFSWCRSQHYIWVQRIRRRTTSWNSLAVPASETLLEARVTDETAAYSLNYFWKPVLQSTTPWVGHFRRLGCSLGIFMLVSDASRYTQAFKSL